jgi:hypothetical protein
VRTDKQKIMPIAVDRIAPAEEFSNTAMPTGNGCAATGPPDRRRLTGPAGG